MNLKSLFLGEQYAVCSRRWATAEGIASNTDSQEGSTRTRKGEGERKRQTVRGHAMYAQQSTEWCDASKQATEQDPPGNIFRLSQHRLYVRTGTDLPGTWYTFIPQVPGTKYRVVPEARGYLVLVGSKIIVYRTCTMPGRCLVGFSAVSATITPQEGLPVHGTSLPGIPGFNMKAPRLRCTYQNIASS